MRATSAFIIPVILLLILSNTVACSDSFLEEPEVVVEPDLNNGPPELAAHNYNQNLEVTYKVAGNYSGKFDMIVLLYNSIPAVPIKAMRLPWEQTFKVPDTSTVIGGYASASYQDGNEGEIINLQMYYGEELLYSIKRAAGENGVYLALESFSPPLLQSNGPINENNIGKMVVYKAYSDSNTPTTLVYHVAEGGLEDAIVHLPFEYGFETTAKSKAASIYWTGFGSLEIGETITLELYIDNALVQTSTVSRIAQEEYASEIPIFYSFE